MWIIDTPAHSTRKVGVWRVQNFESPCTYKMEASQQDNSRKLSLILTTGELVADLPSSTARLHPKYKSRSLGHERRCALLFQLKFPQVVQVRGSTGGAWTAGVIVISQMDSVLIKVRPSISVANLGYKAPIGLHESVWLLKKQCWRLPKNWATFYQVPGTSKLGYISLSSAIREIVVRRPSPSNSVIKFVAYLAIWRGRFILFISEINYPNGKTDTNSCKEAFSVFVTDLCNNSTTQRTPKNCSYLLHNKTMYNNVQDRTKLCKLYKIVGKCTLLHIIVFFWKNCSFLFSKLFVLFCIRFVIFFNPLLSSPFLVELYI